MAATDSAQAVALGAPTPVSSDGSLVRQLRGGSETAADQLYRRYATRLRALVRAKTNSEMARRIDADDIVQSVFRRFFLAAREGHYDVPAGQDLWDLLLVITLNRVRTESAFHRAARRDVRRERTGESASLELEHAVQPQRSEEAILRLIVAEALGKLPPDYRAVIELRMQERPVAEIAAKLQRSKRSVERILQESRRELIHLLDPDI
jgi:RNA polymerase sigma-70 factor (ECF subfamily)